MTILHHIILDNDRIIISAHTPHLRRLFAEIPAWETMAGSLLSCSQYTKMGGGWVGELGCRLEGSRVLRMPFFTETLPSVVRLFGEDQSWIRNQVKFLAISG